MLNIQKITWYPYSKLSAQAILHGSVAITPLVANDFKEKNRDSWLDVGVSIVKIQISVKAPNNEKSKIIRLN